ncbi:MAG: integrase arm-type DNA-binding domain-containing protein [Caldimonas sp.]
MATDKLTEIAVKKAKPGERPIRMFDGGGMYLEVQPSGSKWWRHKFRFGGREKLLSLGVYPETGLANARKQRNEARELLARGIDPSIVRQAQKTARTQPVADSFEAVAREWHVKKQSGWSADHTTRTLRRMDDNVFPFIGAQHINSVTAPMLLAVIRRVESRGAIETAHTIMQQCGQVFRYGIATGRCERNPAPDLRDALKPVIVTHMAAETDPKRVGGLMRSIADYAGHPVTRAALVFSALVFQSPGNVRAAEWSEVDLEAAMWTVPSGKIKRTVQGKLSGRPHLIPLSTQAVDGLRELQKVTGHGRFVFPSLLTGERCMSENTVNTALRRMGYSKTDMTAHGFRAMARTILVEKLNVHPDIIEAQLAHGKSGLLGAAYDRAEFVEQRRSMMQTWADYLDKLRAGGEVVSMRAA